MRIVVIELLLPNVLSHASLEIVKAHLSDAFTPLDAASMVEEISLEALYEKQYADGSSKVDRVL